MRKIIAFLILSFYFNARAQEIEVGFSIGSGATYLVENLDDDLYVDYSPPVVLSAEFKYTPENSFFGIKLKYQNVNGSVEGYDWQIVNNQFPLFIKFSGYVETRTIMFLLEHINDDGESKFKIGYNFGIGLTDETFAFDNIGSNKSTDEFTMINIGGILKYPISSDISLNLSPSFQWNDPLNSLHSERFRMAGEDINLLVEFGLTYKLN